MSLSSEWKAVKAAFEDDESNVSPGTRFGLMFDPVRYSLKPFGLDDKYADFINKTGDQSNLALSKAIGSDDRGGWAANKPVSTIGLATAGYFTGGGLFGGMGSGGGAGASGGSGGLGVFGNGGQAGMSQVGTGNVGTLFGNTGINTGGVSGVGSTGAPGFMQQAGGMQGLMQMGQQLPGMQQQQPQQQQQQGPRPYWYRGRIYYM